jgi:arabinofuranosyltransferase
MKKALIPVAAVLILIITHLIFINWTCDDTYISIRYAENFAAGKGLVFNPGEDVEGYSNFLWVMAAAAMAALSIPAAWGLKALSFLFSLGILWLLYLTAQRYGLDKYSAAPAVLAMAFSVSLGYFAMSGMETVFYAFLLLLAVYLESGPFSGGGRQRFALFGVLLAVSLTRPEGILYLAAAAVYVVIKEFAASGKAFRFSILVAPAAACAAYTGFLFWRFLTFGDILPNTYYAKPAGTFVEYGESALFANLTKAFLSGSYLLLLVILFMVYRRRGRMYLFPVLFCFIQMILMSYAADWMAMGRFFLPVLPIVIFLVFTPLGRILSGDKTRARKISLAALLLIFALTNALQAGKALLHPQNYPYLVMKATELKPVVSHLKRNYPEDTIMAIRRQGYIPYKTGFVSIDLLGLTDITIGSIHHRVKRYKRIEEALKDISEYVIKRKPDVIVLIAARYHLTGGLYAETDLSFRLDSLGAELFEKALANGYRISQILPMGPQEKFIFLRSGSLYSVDNPY